MLPRWLGAADAFQSVEETRGHYAPGRGGGVAACGAGAAAGDAGDRVPQRWLGCPTAPADLGVSSIITGVILLNIQPRQGLHNNQKCSMQRS